MELRGYNDNILILTVGRRMLYFSTWRRASRSPEAARRSEGW
jgi:hypothetical protein